MLGEEEEGEVDDGGVVAVVCWLWIVFSRPCICSRLLSRLIAADMGGEGGGEEDMGNEQLKPAAYAVNLAPLKILRKFISRP